MDDILFAASSGADLTTVTDWLASRFNIKLLGKVTKFLSISVIESPSSFFLSQESTTHDILSEFNMSHVRAVSTPMEPGKDYDDPSSELLVDVRRVREALGRLLWLANSTRPDIAYAVNGASRHREQPRACH